MKSIVSSFRVSLFLFAVISIFVHCTPAARKTASDALVPTATVTCVLMNFLLPEADVMRICNVADDLLPVVRDLLSTQRAAFRAAQSESKDAGGDR